MQTLFTIGIFLSFSLALLLAIKKPKSLPDKLLSLWLGFIGLHLLSYYLYSLGYWTRYPHLVGITLPFPLLHGPMLFLYTLYSLRDETRLRLLDLAHFAPAIACYLYMTPFYFFYSAEEKVKVDQGLTDDYAVFTVILLFLFILSGLIYPILAHRLTVRHQHLIEDNFSCSKRIGLGWLKYCIRGIGFLYLVVGIIVGLSEGMGVSFSFNTDYIFYGLIIFFVLTIGFHGIRHQNLFSVHDNSRLIDSKPAGEYKKSGLKTETAAAIHQQLHALMTHEKPYLNPKLTLGQLASKINVTPNHLSQIINQQEQVNFYDFVNKYWIKNIYNLKIAC